MLPVLPVLAAIAQITVGVAVGNLASDAVNKVADAAVKVVKAKKGEGK